jgi:hypothetical protein
MVAFPGFHEIKKCFLRFMTKAVIEGCPTVHEKMIGWRSGLSLAMKPDLTSHESFPHM